MKALFCFSCVHDSCCTCKTVFFSALKFYFSDSLPYPSGEGKAAAVWGWLELKHDTLKTLTCQLKYRYTLKIMHSLLFFLTGKHLYGKLEQDQH